MPNDTYDTDFLRWLDHQGSLLRRRAAGELVNEAEIDWPNIAEEIETLGRSERREMRARVRTIIEHLAKLKLSPNAEPRQGWIETIARTRGELSDLLEDSPSLAGTLAEVVASQMARGVQAAAVSLPGYGEIPSRPVEALHYTAEQVIGPWLP